MLKENTGEEAMAWSYSQSSGTLTHDGTIVAIGYSGHDNGKNNPDLQAVPNSRRAPMRVRRKV
jgi:hypothetical protein